MRGGVGNEDLHLFATNFIRNRVQFKHLENQVPKNDINLLPRSVFSLSKEEYMKYKDSAKVIIGRIALEHLTGFGFLRKILPKHIPHRYSKVSANSQKYLARFLRITII